ncbi:CoA ester lyase [soil metagenome]
MSTAELAPRTTLFLPASNARAIEKARGLAVDMVLLDLEDAVKPAAKGDARTAAVAAAEQGFGNRLCAIRVNAIDSEYYAADVAAVAASNADLAVLPKVEDAATAARFADAVGKPMLAMIETPAGIYAAREIAAVARGLIAGTNDLRATLKLPATAPRASLSLALQAIVLAARAEGAWALDGVFNLLDDPAGLEAECVEGRGLGFDGKTLIHPNQVEIATRAFSPTEAELEEARALVAAANGGAERFRDRMIEAMHVDQAKALLARASRP